MSSLTRPRTFVPSMQRRKRFNYDISPEYFQAAGTALLSGRTFTWHDDAAAPRVAIVNREFARRIFGFPTNAMGRYFKLPDGTRLQIVGTVEDGKYTTIMEVPHPGDVPAHPAITFRANLPGGAL